MTGDTGPRRPAEPFKGIPSEAMRDHGPEALDIILDGEVLECDPPPKLVQTFRTLWDEEAMHG